MKRYLVLLLLCIASLAYGQALDETYMNMYNPLQNGVTCTDVTLNAAVADAASATKAIYLTKTDRNLVTCTWTLSDNVTIPTTKELFIPRGVTVVINPGATLNACVDAGDYEIFSGAGNLVIPDNCTATVKAVWFAKDVTGLAKADTAAMDSGLPLVLTNGVWTLTSNITLQSQYYVTKGATVVVSGGATLTGCIEAGDYVIFTGTGDVAVPSGCTREIKATWWPKTVAGLTLADAAATASNITLAFTNGTWDIGTSMTLNSVYYMDQGAILNIANGITVTSSTCPNIGYFKTFNTTGTGKISLPCGAVRPEWWGLVCDGVTNNGSVFTKAIAALPDAGGGIDLNAGALPCLYSDPMIIADKPIQFKGFGGQPANKLSRNAETTLRYTGVGDGILVTTPEAAGTTLSYFQLDNSGTAEYGIRILDTNSIILEGVSMSNPTVNFSIAGVYIQAGHSNTLNKVVLTDSAPIGLKLGATIFTYIHDSAIHHHSACNIEAGNASAKSREVRVSNSRLETNQAGYTSAVAVCTRNVEGAYIQNSHLELAYGSIAVKSSLTDIQCEQCIIEDNFINVLNVTPQSDTVFSFALQGVNPAGYVIIKKNRIIDNRPVKTPIPLVDIGNPEGNGGLSYLIVENNEIDPTFTPIVADEALVKFKFIARHNYDLSGMRDNEDIVLCQQSLAVGNVGAGPDDLMPACVVQGNRVHSNNLGLTITVGGTTAANANNKQILLTYAGTTIFDTGAVAANAQEWFIKCETIKGTPDGMSIFCVGNLLADTSAKTIYTLAMVDENIANEVQVIAQTATATDDIVQRYQRVVLTGK